MTTKLGLSKSTVKAFVYFIAAVGGLTPLLLVAAYIYLVEKDEELQESVVLALRISIMFSVAKMLVNYIPNFFEWISTIAKLASINIKTTNLNNICYTISQIIGFVGNIKLILLGLKSKQ